MDQTNLANPQGIQGVSPEQTEQETAPKPALGFVQCRLPWLIAGGVLLLYLFTLPHWVTFLGLPHLARAVGWDWRPVLQGPLQFLLTYPIRWLPVGSQLIALNFLAAACATLALALLARSVALLPHDRTRDQRQFERSSHSLLSVPTAWLPPLLAVLICGLQLTFWENAVVWTGEALDLLLFAYVIRCLLEYRIDERDSWLIRMGFAYGLAMTNNFAMIAFLPSLVIAVVWIKGLSIFKFRSFAPIVLCGLAGLSLYLLLPIVQLSAGMLDLNFWELLRMNLGHQKNSILSFRRVVVLMLSFTSVLPVLFIGIKWPASFGDISAAGNALTNLMTHVIHGVFLLACLYVAFDPGYSPRKLGAPFPFLPFYYLGALSVGYCAGYFLLVFNPGRPKGWQRPSVLRKGVDWAILGLVWAAAIAAPVGLIYKNFPMIRASMGPALSEYAGITTKLLPPQGAVLLSDAPLGQFPFQLYSVYAALKRQGALSSYVPVETGALVAPIYHRYLRAHYPKLWPELPAAIKAAGPVDSVTQVRALEQLSQSKPLYYLQPSFGFYFEHFYLKPHSLVYELKPYATNALEAPVLSAEDAAENVRFWQKMKTEDLQSLRQALKPAKGKQPPPYSHVIGAYYSRGLDYLGVELQKRGDLEQAGEFFALALDFNPESPAALINQDYNRSLRGSHPEALKRSEEMEKRLSGLGGRWEVLLEWGGPLDEPGFRNEMGLAMARGRNYRQAAQELLRISSLTPTNIDARIGLATMCLKAGLLDLCLKYIADVRASNERLHTGDREALIQTEAWAYVYRNDVPSAERILRQAQAAYPLDDLPYSTLAEIYLRLGRITNSMEVLQSELKAQPENGGALNNYARLKILNQELDEAVKLLDHALRLDPKNSLILFNRAVSNLKLNKLDDAQRDYQTLEATVPKVPYTVHFGLFDIAYKKKNFKTAIKYGELYLKDAPRGTLEYKDVSERVTKAKAGSA